MKKIYFVDTENVGNSWTEVAEMENPKECKFIIFYSDHSPRLAYDAISKLVEKKIKIECIKCYTGTNAMDFQLQAVLGRKSVNNADKQMIILSSDRGYDPAVKLFNDMGIYVTRLSLADIKMIKGEPLVIDKNDKTEKCGVPVFEIYTLVHCVGQNSAQKIHNSCTDIFGKETGRNVYNYLKERGFRVPVTEEAPIDQVKDFIQLIDKYQGHNSFPSDTSSYLCEIMKKNAEITNSAIFTLLKKKYGEKANELHKILKTYYQSIKVLIKDI